MGMVYVADPPEGVPLSAILSQAISAALGSPVPLPLDALLTTRHADKWATVQSALLPGSGSACFSQKFVSDALICLLDSCNTAIRTPVPLRYPVKQGDQIPGAARWCRRPFD